MLMRDLLWILINLSFQIACTTPKDRRWPRNVSIPFWGIGGIVSFLNKNLATVTQHIRKLRGGSQPILAQASDGLPYVVKFSNNLQGANLLFNESIGTELYRACNLPVPPWKLLLVTDSFIDDNPESWLETPEGYLRPNAGICFGSRFLGGDGRPALEILPRTSFSKVRNRKSFWLAWLVDACAGHADNRQAVFLEDGAGWLDAYFFDHGHIFGGPKGESQPKVEASCYLDPRIYPTGSALQLTNIRKSLRCLQADQLWRKIQTLPDDWKTESALFRFAQCLGRLSTASFLQNTVDMIVSSREKYNEREDRKWQSMRKPPRAVLRPDDQNTKRGQSFLVKCSERAICA